MKNVYLVRHGNWDLSEDKLTDEGKKHTLEKAATFPRFKIVYTSSLNRAQETANLLSGQQPRTDERAGTPRVLAELGLQIAERRKTNPLGVAGALFEIPEAKPALQQAGGGLSELVQQSLNELNDGEAALIVSHDGTMVSAEKVLLQQSFDEPLDHTYNELEGFLVDENLNIKRL